MSSRSLSLAVLLAAFAMPVSAQSSDPLDGEQDTLAAQDIQDEVVVRGQRLSGLAQGDIAPILSFTPQELESLGANDISEILEALEQETQSGRSSGPPVTLINGRRVANRRSVRAYPSEAIKRVDVLPEETALSYGFRADQRVINFVLVDRFNTIVSDIEAEAPTQGGRIATELDVAGLNLNTGTRTSFDIEFNDRTSLYESERNILTEAEARPLALGGNIAAAQSGAALDPMLDGAFGRSVTVIGAPQNAEAGPLTLNDFLVGGGAVNTTDSAPFRTLSAAQRGVEGTATHTRPLDNDLEATISLGIDYSEGNSLIGLPEAQFTVPSGTAFNPFSQDITVLRYAAARGLQRNNESSEVEAAFSLLSAPASDSWSLTGNYTLSKDVTTTQTDPDVSALQAAITAGDPLANPFANLSALPLAQDRAETELGTGEIEFVINRALAETRYGEIKSTLKIGAQTRDQKTTRNEASVVTAAELSRDQANVQANIDLPLWESSEGAFPGRVSLSGSGSVDELSDFGTLLGYGADLRWEPIDGLRLRAGARQSESAPSVGQLGSPIITTPNSRIFDFTTGQSVFATRQSGGNPDLQAQDQRRITLGANMRPFIFDNTNLSVDYTDTQIDNPIRSFPAVTAQIEAAFPDRFIRNSDGQLTLINTTPVSFDRAESKELRTRLFYRKRLNAKRSEGARSERGSGPARTRPARSRQAGRGGRGRSAGRIDFSLSHIWALENTLSIDQSLPILDLLDGASLDGSGGASTHRLQMRSGLFWRGYGARLSGDWRNERIISGAGADSLNDLRFDSFGTLDLRMFLNLKDRKTLIAKYPWMDNMRVRLDIDNIFDSRQMVTDGSGSTPLIYQRDLIDPIGRTVEIDIRKRF